jgi:acetyl-CoA acetyltransferase
MPFSNPMTNNDIVIAGVGQTDYVSRSGTSEADLAVTAIQRALDDAGLTPADVNGIIANPTGATAEEVISSFALDIRFSAGVRMGGASMVASLGLASAALVAGRTSATVVYIGRNGSSGGRISQRVGQLSGQQFRTQLEHPYGWSTPAQWYATICRRHMYEYGTTKRQLAEVALTMRRHAQLNERAQLYGRPLSLAEYENAPVVADPYQLFDCCLETDGGAAIVVTTAERAARLPQPPVVIEACATASPESPDDLTNRKDWMKVGLSDAAPLAFEQAGVGPGDMDAAMIYDCFTFELLHQLEEGGFCDRGSGGPFVMDGHIGLGGKLPVNPHGGLMAEGHLNGLNHVIEAVRQLRDQGGARQVPGARYIAVTGWGNLGDGAIAILRRQRT